jgi:threonine/homoserine/homoserine lactone efflux protein
VIYGVHLSHILQRCLPYAAKDKHTALEGNYCCGMTTELLIALSAFAFVSSITPGPNNLMLMSSGTNFGFRRTIPHLLGVSIGFTAMIVLIGLGIAEAFSAYPVVYEVLKIVSVVYLLYLAWHIATASAPSSDDAAIATKAKPMTFIQAALFQWVNPKAWTMALTAVSVYVPPTNKVAGLIVLALVFGLINLPSVAVWTVMGSQLRQFLSDHRKLRVFNVTAALLLVASLYPLVLDTVAHFGKTITP